MSQLNESQRLRAEQNRLKALQIRQQKLAALGCPGTPQSTPGLPQSTPGTSQSVPRTPQSSIGPPKFSPPPSKSAVGTPVSTSVVPQAGVGTSKFYTPPSSASSGVIHSASGKIKTTSGNLQPSFRAPQPGVHLGSVGVSGPPTKHPRIEATNKNTSSLPSDVVKRIEENKRKAQERQEAIRRAREQGLSIPPVPAASEGITLSRQHPQLSSHPVHSNTSETKNATKPVGKETSYKIFLSLLHV